MIPSGSPLLDSFAATLPALAADRSQTSPEQHGPNDYYGHAAVLKSFASIPQNKPLRFSIQHGVRLDPDFWKNDYHSEHRVGVVPSQWRAELIAPKVARTLVPIGPYIHYAAPLATAEQMAEARTQLGRTLLVIPAHSTHWIDTAYDRAAFCEMLNEMRSEFHTIFVCLYWKDALRGAAEEYEQRGFPCVTAGHMFELDFLNRLRTFIELSDATISNQISSHIGYCVHLGRPHQLVSQTVSMTSAHAARMAETSGDKRLDLPRYAELFSAPPTRITDEQRAFTGKFWGYDDVRTSDEIRALAEEATRLHARHRLKRWLGPLGRLMPN